MRVRGVAVCGSAVLLLASCSGAVPVDAPEVPAAQGQACRALVDDLPDTIAGQERREVDEPSRAAAWGDPAIVLVCGAELPGTFDDFSACTEANGVGWFVPPEQVEDPTAEVTITAVGHEPVVSVTIPADYRPAGAAAVMAVLAAPVEEHLAEVNPCT